MHYTAGKGFTEGVPKNAVPALLTLTTVIVCAAFLAPRTPQPLSYHNFADHRSWLGVPNVADVASNAAFAIFGIWGLWFLARLTPEEAAVRFVDSGERWFYPVIFCGFILTAAGSAYYHLAPDNARLVWDRPPMALVFMSLVAAMIAERVSVACGLWLWPLLVALGVLSVLEWRWNEQAGHGDLRFYGAVQVYAVLVLLLMLFLPGRYTRTADLAVVVGL